MALIKCIGCYELLREEMQVEGRPLVVYNCPRFAYACALSGLLRPTRAILKAANACPENPGQHCLFCKKTDVTHYGIPPLATCPDHYRAWSKWLDEHPERSAYLKPKGRMRTANWIEGFREFIEDMRRQK